MVQSFLFEKKTLAALHKDPNHAKAWHICCKQKLAVIDDAPKVQTILGI